MKQLLLALTLITLSQQAFSGNIELSSCSDVGANLENIQFGTDNQLVLPNENAGLVVYRNKEQGPSSYGIAVIYNAAEGTGIARRCLAIPFLSSVDLKTATTSFDSLTGATVVVNVQLTDGFVGATRDAKVAITVKRKAVGTVSAGHEVTAEEI